MRMEFARRALEENQMHKTMELFAGAGGGIIASRIIGHEPIIAIEWDKYCCKVLRERAADGWFPGLRVWEGDVRLFDPSEYTGDIFCINAGFPCTDISVAGSQTGIGEGTRSGLYMEVLRIADVVRPEYIFLENVAAIVTGGGGEWLRTIIGDLAERGFDAVWCCLSAAEVGAKHKRDRWWLLAYSNSQSSAVRGVNSPDEKNGRCRESFDCGGRVNDRRKSSTGTNEDVADTNKPQRDRVRGYEFDHDLLGKFGCPNCEGEAEPALGMLADDVPDCVVRWNCVEAQVGRTTNETQNRVDKLKALGNGQVPLQAATAFSILWKMMEAAK